MFEYMILSIIMWALYLSVLFDKKLSSMTVLFYQKMIGEHFFNTDQQHPPPRYQMTVPLALNY